MKVLYKNDTDYIPLPSKDPFVQAQQALLIEMGYRLIEDWEGPSENACEEEYPQTAQPEEEETETVTAEKVYVIDGKTYTESELKSKLA
jgi:hypothetical protein